MRTYEVSRIDADRVIPLTGAVDKTVWEQVNAAQLDEYAWGSEPGPETAVRAPFDAKALYLQSHVEDDEIVTDVTESNGPTLEDSSIKPFATLSLPGGGSPGRYCNFGADYCGAFKLAWQGPN